MLTKSLKQDVWRLILLPALGITLLLGTSLTYLYLTQLNKFVDQRGGALTEKLAHMSHAALRHGDTQLVRALVDASLEEPYVRAIQVYIEPTGERYRSGASMLPPLENRDADMGIAQQRPTPKSVRFAHPLVDNEGNTPLGWIELELLTSPFLVMRYQTILIGLLLTMFGLVLAGWLALGLRRKIVSPLKSIETVVASMAEGHLDQRVERQHSREFQQLAEKVNAMGNSLEQAHKDMQVHIDQSTEDLRETLETIEIQNIELNMARKEALEASRIKSEFLDNTSHEIRTPLNGILGFTNLALKTDLDDQQREYLHTIRDSSQNLLTVINDILVFSKIEANKLTLEYVPLPLRQVVEDAVHILAPDAHEKHLQLVTLIDDKIPLQLLGDPLRLKQVLSNLVSNAIKFSQEGNIVVQAVLLSKQENQITLKFSVSDNGIGLTPEQKAQLFNAFNQADSSRSREHGGTGLGLVICRGLVERMGGDIGVESEPDQGARFWFTARMGVDKRQPEVNKKFMAGRQVLICSDNVASGRQLQYLLEQWQTSTDTIQSIYDAFSYLRKAIESGRSFDLIVLDLEPGERRIQQPLLLKLTEQLQAEFSCKLLVCCTPAHQRLLADQSEAKVTLSFVSKPIAHDAFLGALARTLEINLPNASLSLSNDSAHQNKPTASILVVDDNPANLQLASELLRALGVEVAQANSGKAALERCAEQRFDLIFMDIQMPGMDGIETTQQLRQSAKSSQRTPIIALTAHSMTEQKSELLIAGMDDCISKPVSETQLAHIINRWINLNGRKFEELVSETTSSIPTGLDDRSQLANREEASPVDIPLSLKLANNKPALSRDMLVMLLQNLDAERSEVNSVFEREDYALLEELVHRLYGSCCYVGVPRLKRISGLVDQILQAKQYEQLPGAIKALNNEIEEVLRWGYARDIDALFELDTK